jgi:DNA-binding MarR family transcriptional regulator
MIDPISRQTNPSRPTASALYLREDEVRRGIELLYFGHSYMLRTIDEGLSAKGLGRAHHRALYFIARMPGMIISDLIALLGITKQSLSRVIRDLEQQKYLELRTGRNDRRQKELRLTDSGQALEAALFAEMRTRMAEAYASAGQDAVTGFWHVCEGLIPPDAPVHVTQP